MSGRLKQWVGSGYEAGQAVPAEPAHSPSSATAKERGSRRASSVFDVPATRRLSDVPRTVASTGPLEDSRKQMLKMRKIVQGEGWKTPIKTQGKIVPL